MPQKPPDHDAVDVCGQRRPAHAQQHGVDDAHNRSSCAAQADPPSRSRYGAEQADHDRAFHPPVSPL